MVGDALVGVLGHEIALVIFLAGNTLPLYIEYVYGRDIRRHVRMYVMASASQGAEGDVRGFTCACFFGYA